MKLLKSNLSKNARHLLLISVCFILVTGVFSCSSEETALNPEEQPVGTDDASLLAWQMEKHFKTKVPDSYTMAFVTTKTSFEFQELDYRGVGDYIIDWGDGVTTVNMKTHTYSDGLPAHTIFLYSNIDDGWSVKIGNNEVIFVDISRCIGMELFSAENNRITNIDLSKNINLGWLNLNENSLQSINVSNNLYLNSLFLYNNKLSKIDITMLPLLWQFDISGNTLINSVDVTQNKKLSIFGIDNTKISRINLLNNVSLWHFSCRNCPINDIDLSNNAQMGVFLCSGTYITSLDFSNTKVLSQLECNDCNIKTLVFNSINELHWIEMRNNPIEQDLRKMTSLALLLPDRSKESNFGVWQTLTPHIDMLKGMLDDYNWIITPYYNGISK